MAASLIFYDTDVDATLKLRHHEATTRSAKSVLCVASRHAEDTRVPERSLAEAGTAETDASRRSLGEHGCILYQRPRDHFDRPAANRVSATPYKKL